MAYDHHGKLRPGHEGPARHVHDFRKDPAGPGHLCAVCGCRATPDTWAMSLTALAERRWQEQIRRLEDRRAGFCRHEWVMQAHGIGCRYCRATGTAADLLEQVNTLEAQYAAAAAHDEAQAAAHPAPEGEAYDDPEGELRRAALDHRGQP